jgi:LPXTG-motif cell wall-anchored protein
MRHRWTSRLAVAAAASLLSLGTATAAWAVINININPAHIPTTAAQFQQECKGPFAALPEGTDGWHFVLPNTSGDSFVGLHAIFSNGVTAKVSSTDAGAPSTGSGWWGYIDNAGASNKHVYLFTAAGWTLTDAVAVVDGAQAQEGDTFNLSHTCAGTSTSPSPSASAGTPSPGSSESPDVTPSPSEPGLPVTGAALTGFITAGLALVAGGVVTLFVVRRRRDLPTEV